MAITIRKNTLQSIRRQAAQCYTRRMAKDRKKRKKQPRQQQSTIVHRYTAEVEEKKGKRKKLKIKAAVGAAIVIAGMLLVTLTQWLLF